MNEKYSYKDFTGLSFSKVDAKEFNGTEIVGTCFSQERPMTKIFPPGLTGVKFIKCNLDNVDVPVGSTIKDCCNRQWKEQNDKEPWVLDTISLLPVEPLYKELYQELKISINPAGIPAKKINKSVIVTEMDKLSIAAREVIR